MLLKEQVCIYVRIVLCVCVCFVGFFVNFWTYIEIEITYISFFLVYMCVIKWVYVCLVCIRY